MKRIEFEAAGRTARTSTLEADIVFIGGGIAGTCGAIAAAREGLRTILVQDRPVLGGNASSEVRLWILGATSSMGNNNRWARESGVINEILVDNLHRNPDGNALILDTILLEKAIEEENLTLLLNTAVHAVHKDTPDRIASVAAFCSQNSTAYTLTAPYFCDASGDGIVGFLSGAAFRMGAEAREEFDEGFAPNAEYGELLGHSIYFLTKDMGRPIPYIPPSYARTEVEGIIRNRSYQLGDHGCRLWWLEYGGRLDTVHQTEEIKWELWKVIHGIWNHVKNSGRYPEAENLTLEWMGHIPGKRESRRFEGDHILCQSDVVEQRTHPDAVSYGGWSLDLHPADGVFSERPGCDQWHAKGVYQIPLRCLYSRNIRNLWLAGRTISASHVAFGSTRVMATVAMAAQVVGPATARCLTLGIDPGTLAHGPEMEQLQQALLASGHHIPEVQPKSTDLAHTATIKPGSELLLQGLPADGPYLPLEYHTAQLLPVQAGDGIAITFHIRAEAETELHFELRESTDPSNFTPERLLETQTRRIPSGEHAVQVPFTHRFEERRYAFACIRGNPLASVKTSTRLRSGTMLLANRFNRAVATSGRQTPPPDIGIHSFEFWLPNRRPAPQNLAFELAAPLRPYGSDNLTNGIFRPTRSANCWMADPDDSQPQIELSWPAPVTISAVVLHFDGDFDHPLESTLRVHPERVVPHTVRRHRLSDGEGRTLFEETDNHQTRRHIRFEVPVTVQTLQWTAEHPSDRMPVSLFGIQVYGG